jgi:class 3 adenylate cyclase/tetratricopeptide (TPR) repeat protein
VSTPASAFEVGLIALERLRGEVDDAVLDVALAALRQRLAAEHPQAPPEQQLRQVTVMFVDVVGSTALGGQLNPEDLHEVMDPALARYTALVQRFGGRALQYAGDNLLAAFGTELAREDDAENAVAAGLAILAETRLLADQVRRDHGHPGFNVRVGLHTGPVLLGGGVDAGNTIRGATVNLAARMEQTAPPGTLRISQDTARLVQGLFDLSAQAPLRVKGHDQLLTTWLVERRRPLRAAVLRRGVAGVSTPLIGRNDALAQLQQAWSALHEPAATVRLVSVVAEAGLGKTRLAQHWAHWARGQPDQALWLQVRARQQAERVPYSLLRDLIAEALQLPDSDPPGTARSRFTDAMTACFGRDTGNAEEVADAHVLGHLLGLNFADSPHVRGILQQGGQIRQRALHTAAELLAHLAARAGLPLVLLVDDLQWADTASLDFLCSWPARQRSAALAAPASLLLAMSRPGLDDRQPAWRAAEQRRIQLLPLADTDGSALAQALLAPLQAEARHAEALALQALLVERAGGNPFFMEELVLMLIAQGAIVPVDDDGLMDAAPADNTAPAVPRWRLGAQRLDSSTLPTTLNDVLQAQLDLLPSAERQALQQAAVLGPVFWEQTLAALDPSAMGHLLALQRRGLVHAVDPAAPHAPATYGFAHGFLQQVAYQRLLRRERQPLHARAARWYAALDTARAADYLPVTADHFDSAGEPLMAARYNLLAADNLAQRFGHDMVVDRCTRGLGQAAADDSPTAWRLLMLRQRALRLSGRRDEQARDLDALATLAERSTNPVWQATVALRRTVAADETGHPQTAAALAPLAMAAAQRAAGLPPDRPGDVPLDLAVYGVWCGALRASGQHDEARRIGQQGLARARELAERGPESELLVALAAIDAEQGDPIGSATLLRQALQIQQALGNRSGECVSRINLGVTTLQLGDLTTAEADFDAALRLAQQIGNPTFQVSILLNLANSLLPQGRADEAHASAVAALALARQIGNPEYEAFALMALGAAELARQQADTARLAFAESCTLLDGLDLPHLAIEAVAWSARAALLSGDGPAAGVQVERVLAHVAEHGHLDGTEDPLLIRWTCCEVLDQAGDPRLAACLLDTWTALKKRRDALGSATARERFMQAQTHHRAIAARAALAGLG